MNSTAWVYSRIIYGLFLGWFIVKLMQRSNKSFWNGFAEGLIFSWKWVGRPLLFLTAVHVVYRIYV